MVNNFSDALNDLGGNAPSTLKNSSVRESSNDQGPEFLKGGGFKPFQKGNSAGKDESSNDTDVIIAEPGSNEDQGEAIKRVARDNPRQKIVSSGTVGVVPPNNPVSEKTGVIVSSDGDDDDKNKNKNKNSNKLEKGEKEDKVGEFGISCDEIIAKSVNYSLPQFVDCTTSRMASESYGLEQLPNLYTLSNLGALLCDMPGTFIPKVVKGGMGTTYRVDYRWSDGSLVKEVKETMVYEELEVVFFTTQNLPPIEGATPTYLYPVSIEASFREVLSSNINMAEKAKVVRTLLGGKDDTAAVMLMQGMGGKIDSGDNHIAILINMCRYYLSALVSQASGSKPEPTGAVIKNRDFIVAKTTEEWLHYIDDVVDTPVSCRVREPDYLHFLVTMTKKGASQYKYYAKEDNNYTNVYDNLDLQWDSDMTVISTHKHNYDNYTPRWPGDQFLIKGYIERYVHEVAVGTQLDEAFKIATVLPYLQLEGDGGLSIPNPIHTSDIFSFFTKKMSGPTLLAKFADHFPLRQILSAHLTLGMMNEAVNSFAQGMLYSRDREVLTSNKLKHTLSRINLAYSHREEALIYLINFVSGLDFSFLVPINMNLHILYKIVRIMQTPVSSTLFKLLISSPVLGSTSWSLRRGVTMVSENVNSYDLRISWEMSMLLRKLGFEKDGSANITGVWDYLPYETSDRLSLDICDSKRLHFWAIKDKVCRLYLEMLSFKKRPEYTLDVKGDNVEDVFASFLKGLGNQRPRREQATVIESDLREKSVNDNVGQLGISKKIETMKDVTTISMPNTLKIKKVPKGVFESMLSTDERTTMLSFEEARMRAKASCANSIYIQNTLDCEHAKAWFKKNQFDMIRVEGDGNCGPRAGSVSLQHCETPFFADHLEIRERVSNEMDLEVMNGEWWTESEWTIFGSLYDTNVIVQVIQSGTEIDVLCLYRTTSSNVVVIRATDYTHFDALVSKKGNRVYPPKSAMIRTDGVGGGNKKGDSSDSRMAGADISVKEVADAVVSKATEHKREHSSIKNRKNVTWNKLRKFFGAYGVDEYSWIKDAISTAFSVGNKYKINIDAELLLQFKEGKQWDAYNYNNYEVKQLLAPMLLSGLQISGVDQSVPQWMYFFKKIYDNKRTWDHVSKHHKEGKLPPSMAKLWHMILWPFHTVPSDLVLAEDGKFVARGCKCFACNVMSKNWSCPKYEEYKCCMGRKEKIVDQQPTTAIGRLLPRKSGELMNKEERKKLNVLYPFSHRVGARKSNMDVGTYVNLISKRNRCPKMWRLVRDVLNWRIGDSNNLVTALLMWLNGNSCSVNGHIAANSMGVLGTCTKHWIENFKEVHDHIRAKNEYGGYKLEPKDHSQLMYMHLLYGRMGQEVDWKEEWAKRTRERKPMASYDGKIWTEAQFTHDINRALDKVVDGLKKSKTQPITLKEFWGERWAWMASGSATGKGKFMNTAMAREVSQEDISKKELNNNKRAICEKMTYEQIIAYMGKTKEQRAYSHTKANELAKVRAIFGVEMEHYILHSYICRSIEPALADETMAIREDASKEIKDMLKRQSWAESNREINSFDFADFNDQHELWVMRLLHLKFKKKLAEWYGATEAGRDLDHVSNWLAETFMNTMSLDPLTNRYIKWTGGMFSGNRATTLINTILNKAYVQVVIWNMERIYGQDPVVDSYHTGDDISMLMKSHSLSMQFNQTALKVGMEAQTGKQLVTSGQCEYLRLTYYPNGEVLGSLCRSLGSFVNGNWESDVEVEPVERARACWDQVGVLYRRGFEKEMAQVVYENLLEYYSRAKVNGLDTLPLPIEFVQLKKSCGGLGLSLIGTGELLEGVNIQIAKEEGPPVSINTETITDKLLASNDYIKTLNERILPKWAKIRKQTRKRAVNVMAKSTIGLEIPRKIRARVKVEEENRLIAQAIKENRERLRRVEPPEKEPRSFSEVLTNARVVKKIRSRQNYADKFKQIYPLLSYDSGYNERALRQKIEGDVSDKLKSLDEDVDRLDGSAVPPQFYSLIKSYANVYNLDPAPYYRAVMSDGNISKFKY